MISWLLPFSYYRLCTIKDLVFATHTPTHMASLCLILPNRKLLNQYSEFISWLPYLYNFLFSSGVKNCLVSFCLAIKILSLVHFQKLTNSQIGQVASQCHLSLSHISPGTLCEMWTVVLQACSPLLYWAIFPHLLLRNVFGLWIES